MNSQSDWHLTGGGAGEPALPRDGDGVWKDGKWHPDAPIKSSDRGVKFCRDCKFLRVGADYTYAKCGYTVPGEMNLVTGEPKQQPLIYCDGLRESKNELC